MTFQDRYSCKQYFDNYRAYMNVVRRFDSCGEINNLINK